MHVPILLQAARPFALASRRSAAIPPRAREGYPERLVPLKREIARARLRFVYGSINLCYNTRYE